MMTSPIIDRLCLRIIGMEYCSYQGKHSVGWSSSLALLKFASFCIQRQSDFVVEGKTAVKSRDHKFKEDKSD